MTRKSISTKISTFIKTAALSAAFATFTASAAHAGLTTVKAPHNGELGIEQILENTYGGNFSASGNDFSNGTISATRIDDSVDQEWSAGTYDICAKAKFSGYTQTLGVISHGDNTIQNLFTSGGFGLGCTGTASNVVLGDTFCFSRDGDSGLDMSEDNENSDGRDHMVTFKINGLSNDPTYLLFFEDLNLTGNTWGNRSYADFNDLVVQVSRLDGQSPAAAPLPAAFIPGMLLLAGNGVYGMVRKAKRAAK
jgi:hypothetical protein